MGVCVVNKDVQQAVPVAQIDREAAADLFKAEGVLSREFIDDMRAGYRDQTKTVQAFASHRLTHQSGDREALLGLRDMLAPFDGQPNFNGDLFKIVEGAIDATPSRLTEPARKADRLGEAFDRKAFERLQAFVAWAEVDDDSKCPGIVPDDVARLLAALPDPTHTREGELEAALKPFAEAAGDWDYHDGTPALHEYPDASSLPEINDLTIGDLRRARAAVNARGGA
jgi:hypothetical protein